jgi:hypothetical protein
MFTWLTVAGLVLAAAAAAAVAAALGVVWLVFRIVWWTVLLPLRVLFKILMIPVWLTIGAIGLAAGAALLPVVLLVAGGVVLVGALAALLALLLPLVPLVLFGLLIWALGRRRPAVA